MSDNQLNARRDRVSTKVSRRRCLQIVAASCGAGLCLGSTSVLSEFARTNETKIITWKGIILGADASITLHTDKERVAKSLIVSLLKEVKRLEGYFSLYQDNSALSQLNRLGVIKNPSPEFYELISLSLETAHLTDGRFDPTVQPLFMAYKTLAKRSDRSSLIWDEQESVIEAKRLINWQNVSVHKSKIQFSERGMGMTLNGIAQGYITDRVVEILAAGGLEDSLINFGEYRGLGSAMGKEGWDIQLGAGGGRPVWNLRNEALAASARSGMVFDQAQGLHHLLDPKTGGNQPAWHEIYVCAPRAALADAASTALFAAPPREAQRIFDQLDVKNALLIKRDGTMSEFTKTAG